MCVLVFVCVTWGELPWVFYASRENFLYYYLTRANVWYISRIRNVQFRKKGIDFSDLLSEWLRRGFDCRCRYRCPTSFITLIAFHFSEARIACSLCSQNIYSPRVGAEFVFFFRTFLFVLATFLHFTFCLLFCFFVFCLFCFLLLCCTLFAVRCSSSLPARSHSLTLTRAFTPYFTSKVQIAHTISFALVSAAVVVACSASDLPLLFPGCFSRKSPRPRATTSDHVLKPRVLRAKLQGSEKALVKNGTQSSPIGGAGTGSGPLTGPAQWPERRPRR